MVIFHSYVSLPEGRFYPVAKRGISQQRRGWFSCKTVMILAAWASGPSKIGHNHATIQILGPKSSHHHIPHHIFDDMMGWCTIRWFRTYIYHKTRCDIQQYHDLLSCNQAWHYIEHHMKKSQHMFAMDFDDFPHFPSPQCGISPSHPSKEREPVVQRWCSQRRSACGRSVARWKSWVVCSQQKVGVPVVKWLLV